MTPHSSYMGAGTRSSPIAIDDSEDEVVLELSHNSNKSSPRIPSPLSLPEDENRNTLSLIPPIATLNISHRPPDINKKRKRANSFSSQEAQAGSPSPSTQISRRYPTLVNRLSQPESKKARKRRRKAERQALEEARVQNINWLNPAPAHASLPPIPSWSMEVTTHPLRGPISYSPRNTPDPGPGYIGMSRRMPSPRNTPPPGDYLDPHPVYRYPYENIASTSNQSSPPPATSSDWVSSMALAADNPFTQNVLPRDLPQWSPMTMQAPLPPVPPPPMPPPDPVPASSPSKAKPTPRPAVEHHALPMKPAPPQPVAPIGMKPDQDPNSKHGIFHITSSTKEAGSDMKKRSASYIPNPARTLVIEQLPKTHRHPDFINNWSRSACGSAPVHIFIDAPGGKALIEFATAEQARKAWASPKLGTVFTGLKPHQLKGKPREDLIKVWWYRVDGVGAGAGVGEIEEGEIEGEAFAEKEVEVVPKKETKKERKARLAKEREEKSQRKLELKAAMEQQWPAPAPPPQLANPPEAQMQTEEVGIPPSAQSSTTAPSHPFFLNQTFTFAPFPNNSFTPHLAHVSSFVWNPVLPSQSSSSTNTYNKAAPSLQDDQDDQESIASSARRSASPSVEHQCPPVSAAGQVNEQYEDEEVDMEVDTDELSPVTVPQAQLPALNPIHHSLPARPKGGAIAQPSKPPQKLPPPPSATAQVFVPRSSQNITPAPPKSAPSPLEHKPSPPARQPAPKIPLPTRRPAPVQPPKPTTSLTMLATNNTMMSIVAPQPKLPNSLTNTPSSEQIKPPPSGAAIAPSTSASSLSSSSLATSLSSTRSTPVPSEPKAMKNAPTEPSFTKRALMARQQELAEKIAKSKMELAAAAAANKSGTPVANSVPTPQVKPAMDLGEKQALEDRLRKLVLQSRKPVSVQSNSTPPTASQSSTPQSTTAAEKPVPPKSSKVSVSADVFSLEEMAVSFITQTIETIKSQPTSVPEPPPSPPLPSAPRAGPQNDVRLELAAKQKLLEDHISETKLLMSQMSWARTKEEKDSIMRTMREKTRLFEEASKTNMSSSSSTSYRSRTTTTQQFHITRWPASREGAGVLILSDDEDESEDE